ncbi:unnamed protein product [Sphenostylis stenocarpa]|uniref:Uncharacterized protein n=1 Tax=Sphenostylis stenocarpa TaxID=92480 RepID=A0AA86S4Z7_9FABA|nr:unnamed protein product [Sphenostylis stenocarpa]
MDYFDDNPRIPTTKPALNLLISSIAYKRRGLQAFKDQVVVSVVKDGGVMHILGKKYVVRKTIGIHNDMLDFICLSIYIQNGNFE